MKIIEVTFFETFTIHALDRWKKIGFKAEIQDGDDIRQCLYKLQKQTEDFFFESTKAAEKQIEVNQEEKPSLTKVAELIKEINFCKSIEHLKAYYYIAKGDEDLYSAYEDRFTQLDLERSAK